MGSSDPPGRVVIAAPYGPSDHFSRGRSYWGAQNSLGGPPSSRARRSLGWAMSRSRSW